VAAAVGHNQPRRRRPDARARTKASLDPRVAAHLLFATCATRRAVDPSDATAVGLKALLSIHRVYALPLVAGRTRSPALIARQVSSSRSARTSCSPTAGNSTSGLTGCSNATVSRRGDPRHCFVG
jgi:hypothetical protein